MRKSFFSIAMTAVVVCVMAACGNKGNAATTGEAEAAIESSDDSPAMKLLNSVEFTEEGLASMVKTPEGEPLSDTELEAFYLAYSKVNINEETLDLERNPVNKAFSEAKRGRKVNPNKKAIETRLLSNTSPQVRGVAMEECVSQLFGGSSEEVATALKALESEKDPFVLKKGVRALMNELKRPEVAKFVLGLIGHENKNVRKEVAIAVGNPWSKDVPGILDAARKLMADEDVDVKKAIFSGAGRLGDDSIVPDYVKLLNDDSQSKVHGEAMRGLCALWCDYPKYENSSKAAYEATLNFFKKTPRTNVEWTTVTALSTQGKDLQKLFDRDKFVKAADIVKVFSDVAADPDMNFLGRTPAAKVVLAFGSKADVEKLRAKVAANANDSKKDQVLSTVDNLLK